MHVFLDSFEIVVRNIIKPADLDNLSLFFYVFISIAVIQLPILSMEMKNFHKY
jgi:hypothetical protein